MKIFILMHDDEVEGAFRSFDKALDRLCLIEYGTMKHNPYYHHCLNIKKEFNMNKEEIPYEIFKEWAVNAYQCGDFAEWDIFEVEVEEDNE